jgi:hypothetical protein
LYAPGAIASCQPRLKLPRGPFSLPQRSSHCHHCHGAAPLQEAQFTAHTRSSPQALQQQSAGKKARKESAISCTGAAYGPKEGHCAAPSRRRRRSPAARRLRGALPRRIRGQCRRLLRPPLPRHQRPPPHPHLRLHPLPKKHTRGTRARLQPPLLSAPNVRLL